MSPNLFAKSEERSVVIVNAVGYVRVSGDIQIENGHGLEIQKESILKFCNDNPKYNLIKTFEDPAFSGSHIDRPGLLSLLEEAKKGLFQIVIVHKLDRIARDTYFTLYIEKQLRKYGVSLYSISEPGHWDSPSQRMFLQLLSSVGEFERSLIRERLLSGRTRKAGLGRYAGGKPPRGYIAKNGELMIDETEAVIIERIFKLKRYGKRSAYKIAQILNKAEIKSKYGKRWYPCTVDYILKNPVYKGMIRYGKSEKGIHQKIALYK
ncbi:MAG: recombinase family protein [Elusimicrobia bacterium]|nr:recombinase family protein [Elusimicrobiota bacterium]